MYEGNTRRRDSYHFVAGWGSILVLASASVSSGRAGVSDSAGTVDARRTRVDRRRAPSLPSHSAGNPACTLRVVHGTGTTLPVAIRLRSVCRQDLPGSVRLSGQPSGLQAQSGWTAGWLRAAGGLL